MKRMRQMLITVFTLVILVSLWVPPLAAQNDSLQPGLAAATLRLNVRAEASRDSDLVTTLEPGDLVNVLELDGTWAHIEVGDVAGWVMVPGPTGSPTLVNVNGPTPAPRGYHQMVYDSESDRVILLGGAAAGMAVNDTWSYEVSTNTWTRMAPAQPPRPGAQTLAYDIQSDRTILFLAPFESEHMPSGGASETWAYDLNTDTWTNLVPAIAPPQLLGPVIVYDAESDRIILFGGIDAAEFVARGAMIFTDETWAYDYDTNTWTQMDPEVRPPGVNFQPMAYDAGADRVVMVVNAHIGSDDTWVYDYNTDTWEQRQTVEGPHGRDYSAMVYAVGIGQIILFGNGEPVVKNDTWAYDSASNTWTNLGPETSPSKRGWHAMAHSTAAEQIVLFGGGKFREDWTLETWLYDPAANSWTQVGP